MKHLTLSLTIIVALFVTSSEIAISQTSSAAQRLMFEVRPVVSLVVTGDPNPMIIAATLGGDAGHSVREQSTRYSLVTNVEQMRILASLNEPMPAGTSLRVQLESSRGVSTGEVDLSQSGPPREVVSGVRLGCDRDLVIAYDFSADPQIAEMKPFYRTIVLTLTN